MSDYTKTIALDASPDVVFEALTNPASLSGWWGQASGDGGEGGTLTFLFSCAVKVLRVERAERRRGVTWSVLASEPQVEWVGTKITFAVEDSGAGTLLDFRHVGLTPELECFDQCRRGWDQYLTALAAYVGAERASMSAL
jgi:uncharacterized protein YndB with AHSA1/START domain